MIRRFRVGGVGVDRVPFLVIARAARIWAGVDGVRVDRLTPPPAAAAPHGTRAPLFAA